MRHVRCKVGSQPNLDFDVPRALDEALQQHALVAEGGRGLALGGR